MSNETGQYSFLALIAAQNPTAKLCEDGRVLISRFFETGGKLANKR